MPHLTLEYTSNLDEWAGDPDLLLALHHLLTSVAGIEIANCKSRWRMVDEWLVGEGETSSAFVHLDIRFLEGRSLEVRQTVGAGALDLLRSHFGAAEDDRDLQITVEILEIRRALYFKHPAGTLGPPPLSLV
jgi:5-carboxymethyl-2-hydroxymuconate isomerase